MVKNIERKIRTEEKQKHAKHRCIYEHIQCDRYIGLESEVRLVQHLYDYETRLMEKEELQ